MSSTALVWLITGCSSGIGRELAIAVLERGDHVIATTRLRSFESIKDLKDLGAHVMVLDVTESIDKLKAVAAEAIVVYGKVDVVVNNAGFIMPGSFEETTHEETLTQFNTNVFGALNVARAFLPYMRKQRTGTISFIGSCYGWRPVPFCGLYVASKFAIRGISDTLHEEIAPFGLRSICFDFGAFRTPIIEKLPKWVPILDAYKDAGESANATLLAYKGTQKGDTVRGAYTIIDIIRGEGMATGRQVHPGFALGSDSYETVKKHCENTLARLEEWKPVSLATDYPDN
ncbi:Oxidoreductase BOA17 [Psilocybe cubensis]|uniref:Uncharacterized protein n=2 Tax=Psilocybe cubensis TaxID=181762 RepID=A0A8H7XQ08_PSICU|nr:Oxidoreductase BOA17 [Psilocybe cubensis]KAH9477890.1 Oxidoreductase BOA17 [Psilocybe cubensis]